MEAQSMTTRQQYIVFNDESEELEEEVELLKKIQGLCAHQKSVRFQYLVEQQHRYSIRKACMTLGISRSGFYAYCERKPSDRQLENEVLSQKIREVFEQHSGQYGAKRIAHSLQDEGIKVNRKRIEKLMRSMGLYTKGARRAYKNYNNKHSNRAWANVLQQDFTQDHRNKVWLGDST